jgi:hypothetical protein
MSLIEEIHNQKPAVRYTLFGLAVFTVLSVIGYFGITAMQRSMFMALHPDPQEQQAFIAQQEANSPKPLAALAHIAGALTASIGSLLHINGNAGFDSNGQQDTIQGDAHLLPLSK